MYNNVCVFVLFAIFGSTISFPTDPNNFVVDEDCMTEAGIERGESFNETILLMESGYVENTSCYNLCVEKKVGLITVDGRINGTIAAEQWADELGEAFVNKVINKCNNIEFDDNQCRAFFDVWSCAIEMMLEKLLSAFFDDSDEDEQ